MTNLGRNSRRLASTAATLAAVIVYDGVAAFRDSSPQQARRMLTSPAVGERASFGCLGSGLGSGPGTSKDTSTHMSELGETGTALNMAAGRGMGMASPAAPKKGGKKKKAGAGGGMGIGGGKGKKSKKKSGESPAAPFDVSAALLRSERLYEEIVGDAAKEIAESDDDAYNFDSITTEYVIAARSAKANGAAAAVSDWVPVAQLVTVRPVSDYSSSSHDDTEHRDSIQMAVSANCRELHHAATIAAPVFKSVPRNDVQYGCEPIDSFYRFVYDDVIEGKTPGAASSSGSKSGAGGGDDGVMTKSRARTVLDLEDGCSDMATIKRAYREKSFQLHPDRFIGDDRTEEDRRDAARDFASVKTAYEVLCSGVRNGNNNGSGSRGQSWYESLGGRQRTEFYAPVELVSISKAQKTIEGLGGKTAVVGLDYDIVMSFVARNQAAAAVA